MKLIYKFIIVNICALLYAAVSFYIAQWWIGDLTNLFNNYYFALVIILFIAIIPGYLNILLLSSLFMYRYNPIRLELKQFPPITILVPVYNEKSVIKETFRGVEQQKYPNDVEIIVIDDGSQDGTISELEKIINPKLRIIKAKHGGKAHALNIGLKQAKYEIIVTFDADTFLHKHALKRIVARILEDSNCAAVAGHVLVKNERRSRLARLQTWDYLLGISAVKIEQGMFHGTLVAQGAFSVFRKQALLTIDGWWDRLGEDIVLTWGLLKKGYEIGYEPTAFAFTDAPIEYNHFLRQRKRWSRGMIEGFKDHIELIWKTRGYSSFFVAVDVFFPFIDFFYTFVFLPGLIMAAFGHYYIVGLWTLLVIPLNICVIMMMLITQRRFMRYAGLKFRHNLLGAILYVIVYQMLMSPICVLGYFQELLNFKRKW